MIRPLPNSDLADRFDDLENRPHAFPTLDRAFDAVERTLARLGVDNPATLRSPRPVEEALSETALPEGTLLILSATELRAAEVDIEDTVKDERTGGSVYLSLPLSDDLPGRARGLRELASAAPTFGFNASLRPAPGQRLGRVKQVPTPLNLRSYRFLVADTPGFRVAVVARALPTGGFIGLWSGNDQIIDELREVLTSTVEAAGYTPPAAASSVPALEGVTSAEDVWKQAEALRTYRVVREAELREIARAAALRGVALRREREAVKRRTAPSAR